MRHGVQRLIQFTSTVPSRHLSPCISSIPIRHRRWQSTETPTNVPTLGPRQWSTPLAKTIADAIEVTGPISIAAYMRQCLTSDRGGYYTTTHADPSSPDQFGKRGDFITSPEISQIFGELVGLWFMTEWLAQGRPDRGVQLIEMGPGRGTLMDDMLRTISQFKRFAGAIDSVWLVEAGEGLRRKQKDLLCGAQAELQEIEKGTWEAKSKQKGSNGNGIPIRWVEDIALLPSNTTNSTPFIIAHEFFDALPIHAFESVAPKPEENRPPASQPQSTSSHPRARLSASKVPQWRELLVAPTKRKFTLPSSEQPSSPSSEPNPDFHLVLAKASNPTSLVLPERPRYLPLKNQVSSRIEISPESHRYIQDFARRIGPPPATTSTSSSSTPKSSTTTSSSTANLLQSPSSSPLSRGAALLIDYGPASTIPINSLRAIKSHKVISPFIHAGQADVSADVDFTALAEAALDASEGVEVHGPVEQGSWLLSLGIKERAEKIVATLKRPQGRPKQGESADTAGEVRVDGHDVQQVEEKIKMLETGWKRLVEGGPRGMGKAYKVMAIVPENGGKRRPVGFGGDVVG